MKLFKIYCLVWLSLSLLLSLKTGIDYFVNDASVGFLVLFIAGIWSSLLSMLLLRLIRKTTKN